MDFSKSVLGSLVQISNLNISDTIKNAFNELKKITPPATENIHIHQEHVSLINCILEPAYLPENEIPIDGSTVGKADDKSCCWDLDELLAKILIQEYCLPTLATVSSLTGQVASYTSLSSSICLLIEGVCRAIATNEGVSTADNLLAHCSRSLDILHKCRNDPMLLTLKVDEPIKLPVSTLVDLCNKLVRYLIACKDSGGKCEWKDTVQLLSDNLIQLIAVEDEKTVVKLCSVLARLIDLQPEKKRTILSSVWSVIQDNESDIQKAFAILCALADYFLPVTTGDTVLDDSIVSYTSFWKLIQAGIPHKNTLARKRSLYLLKRIVDVFEHGKGQLVGQDSDSLLFWWDAVEEKSLMTVWQDFMLLVEMLEESVVHVIRPLFPRLKILEAATHKRKTGPPYLHTSWLLTLLQRALNHDSLLLMKWGLESLLDVDCKKSPIFIQNQHQFFYSQFLVILNESQFFTRPPGAPAGSCPPIAIKLATFLQHCIDAQETDSQKHGFIKDFLAGVKAVSWNGMSLMFVCRAFAELEPAPLFDQECIHVLRYIVLAMITTVEVQSRGAIQCFLMRAILRLVNVDKVVPEDIINFLSVMKSEESYHRGSPLWQDITQWLKEVTSNTNGAWNKENLLKVLRSSLAERMRSATISDLKSGCSASGEAKLILLLLDADVISVSLSTGETSFDGIMFPILDVLSSASTRLYLPREKADEALHILVCLLNEMGGKKSSDVDQVRLKIEKVLEPTRKDILDYVSLRLLNEIKDIVELPIQSLCISSLELLSSVKPDQRLGDQLATIVISCVQKLEMKSSNSTLDVIIQSYSAIQTLAAISKVIGKMSFNNRSRHLFSEAESKILAYVKRNKITDQLPKLASRNDIADTGPKAFNENTDMGWLISHYMMYQWQVIHFCLERSPIDDVPGLADDCLHALDTGSSVVNQPVFRSMKILMPKLVEMDCDLVVRCLKAAWSSLLEFRRDSQFWPAYECFVAMCFQDSLLLAAEEGTALLETILQFCDKIFDFGEERGGIVNVFSSYLCRYLLQEANMKHANMFVTCLARMSLFGPVHQRSVRFFRDTYAYIKTVKYVCPTEDSITSLYTSKEDHEVRLDVINFLCSLDPSQPYHVDFIRSYTEEIKHLQRETMKETKYRHYPNTLQHRASHRLVGTLVVIEQYLEQDDVEAFLKFLTEEVLLKEVQPSVRYLMEMTVVRIFLRFPSTLPTLWVHLKQSYHMRPALMCSWLCILSQMVAAIDVQEDKESFFMQAIPLVFPLCMAHQFNLRIYGQSTMLRMWMVCEEKALSKVLERYQIMEAIKTFHDTGGNSSKTSKKLLDHFLFKINPMEDYSMKTVFETLPRLSDVIDEEWLTPEMFLAHDPTWSDPSAHRIPLYPRRADLEHALPGTWKMKVVDDDDASGPTDGDVQRKITPWKCMLPSDEEEQEMVYMNKQKTKNGLVLVASLINKPPNLGGLCRTSEVFGISQLVLGSLNVLKDPVFQSLSVTSEKWVPIREVAPHMLMHYLSEMRNRGYTLIGVEQTANSVCMTEFTFPEKSLLLLGHEKGGIPVELIQHLDVCVEIPQQGVIRSLNVHVSGALLVWEYRRQQLLKSSAEC